MPDPGKYQTRLKVLKRSTRKERKYGEAEETFAQPAGAAGRCWANVVELSAGEREQAGVLTSETVCRIEIRGERDITAADRLQDADTGALYLLAGVRFADNETICEPATRQIQPEA